MLEISTKIHEIKDDINDEKESNRDVSSMKSLGDSVDEFNPEYQEFIVKLN